MNIESIKQSKTIKILRLSVILAVTYLVSAYLLVFMYRGLYDLILLILDIKFPPHGFRAYEMADIIHLPTLSVVYILMFVVFYFVIYKNKKTKYRTLQRFLLYALFFDFSACAIVLLLRPAFVYIHLLSLFWDNAFYIILASFITYILLTLIIEIKQRINDFIKPLIYWFLSIIISGYGSLLLLLLFSYPRLDYLKECIPWLREFLAGEKGGIEFIPNYCVPGGKFFIDWAPLIQGLAIFIFVTLFIILYFTKFSKTKNMNEQKSL
jgi:preprotein translocase subunit YajC